MKLKQVLLITLFAFSNITNSSEQYICEDTQLEEPPFYVSDEYRQGDKIWENLRNINDQNNPDQYIPKGSIVYTPPAFFEVSDTSDRRVPIKVLSVPSLENENKIRNSKKRRSYSISSMINTTGNKKRAERFSVGWIDVKSLRKASDYTFFVKKDSPLYKTPKGTDINDKEITLSVTNGKFDVQRCCTPDSVERDSYCFDKYKLNIIKNDKVVDYVFARQDFIECNLLGDLKPISNQVIDPVRNILNIMRVNTPTMAIDELEILPAYHQYSGSRPILARSEMVKINIDDETGDAPFGSFHYRPDDKVSSDAYLKPNSQCAFLQVLKKHNKDCKDAGCQVQFGDMYHHDAWGAHSGHDSGECVDIRPFRKSDDSDAGLTYKQTSRYDREKTKSFIKILLDAGARYTIFNDRKISGISRDSSGVHDDHIHVCFGENVKKVQDTCKNGL